MERREQVFVSSTYVDLKEERQEVIQTLLEADCIPAGMELFPASDDDRWTLIKRVIDDCDYYIVVVGGRYGSVDPEAELSYTEMEFDYAVAVEKPVLGFLHGDPGSIPADKTDLNDESRQKLEAFRDKVAERMVKYWHNPSELGGQVAKSLIQIRKTHPAEGWVRARDAVTPELQAELAELRARVAELNAEREAVEQATRAVPLDELAQGDDIYMLSYYVHYWTEEQVKDRQMQPYNTKRWHGQADVTWNDIFAFLSPLMLDEASEQDLDSALDDFVARLIVDRDEPNLLPAEYGRARKVTAAADVIHDVKIQLSALGLAQKSERRRPVSDQNTYWTLTLGGGDHLTHLRAIRRDKSEPAADSDTQ